MKTGKLTYSDIGKSCDKQHTTVITKLRCSANLSFIHHMV